MKIGVRWQVGAEPPAAVPEALRNAVRNAEAAHPRPHGSWTLTWLEGHPVATTDDGTRVTASEHPALSSEAEEPGADDDWLREG